MWTRGCISLSSGKETVHLKVALISIRSSTRNLNSIRFIKSPCSPKTKNTILFNNRIHVSKWNMTPFGNLNIVRTNILARKPEPATRHNPRKNDDPAEVIFEGKKRDPLLPPGIANLNKYSNRGLFYLVSPFMGFVGVALVVFGIFSIYTGIESYMWKKAEGTVLTCNYIKIGKRALVYLEYEYRDHKNERHVGRRIRTGTPFVFIEPIRKPELLTPGATIQVLYDESHPGRATLLPGSSNILNLICVAAGIFTFCFL